MFDFTLSIPELQLWRFTSSKYELIDVWLPIDPVMSQRRHGPLSSGLHDPVVALGLTLMVTLSCLAKQ